MRLSRRQMLGTGLAAGMMPLLLPRLARAQPRRGGHITAASLSSSTADTLDPAKGALSTDYCRHAMFYNGLTDYDENGQAHLCLAESLDSSDQMTWRVTLRDDVTFHDGSKLRADDVVFSLLRLQDPASGSKVKPIASQMASVRAFSPRDVEIVLTSPNVDLPSILAQSHFYIIKAGTKDFSKANGTGPFRCQTFQPGVRTLGVRNEDYFRAGRPYLDSLELIGIPDEVARVNALLSGDVQMIIAVNPRSTRRIRESGTHDLLVTPSGLYTNLIMRRDGKPTGSPDFVLGMKHLFDRELVKRALFRDYATIGNDHPIPPFDPFYRADLPQRTLDLDRARYHFARADLPSTPLPLYCSPAADGSVDMASVLQEYGSKVGLKLAVNRMPADGYWSTHWMKHPLGFGNTNPRPTADLVFSLFYKSTAAWNESGWQNERFDRLLLEARAQGDFALRKEIYGEMQEIVAAECGTAIPVFINLIDGFDKRVKGLRPIPLGGFMGYKFPEHVWWEG